MKKETIYSLDTFGGRLQELRIKKGLSRKAFYMALRGKNGERIPDGYGEKTVRSWESGSAWPSAELIKPICQLLGCCSDYLLCNIQEKDHDIKFICEETGLSEEAVERLTDSAEMNRYCAITICRIADVLLASDDTDEITDTISNAFCIYKDGFEDIEDYDIHTDYSKELFSSEALRDTLLRNAMDIFRGDLSDLFDYLIRDWFKKKTGPVTPPPA